MKRSAFYKEYYESTNRIFADRTVWSAKDRETAWRKGQIYTTKTERWIVIVAQYCILLATGISFATGNSGYGIIGCAAFLLCSIISDFSILKIEMLYRIFSHNTPYSIMLYQAFSGKADDFWRLVQPNTKKIVSGFVRTNRNKFVVKYRVVFRRKREIATVIITPFNVVLKSEIRKIVFDDPTKSLAQIATDLSEGICSLEKEVKYG